MLLFFFLFFYGVIDTVNVTVTVALQQENFLWGVATAAYQIEGAVTEDGRGETVWDRFTKVEGKIAHGDNGDIADDSYHKYREDIALVKGMGMNAYRFSIAWTRIIPDGDGEVNQFGVDYYNNVITTCIENDIEPLVTLYHWDLPQALEDRYGGWLSAEIEQSFVRYVDVCFKLFGDRVKKWITLNEPWSVALQGYMTGAFAPGRCSDRSKCTHGDSSTEGYIAAHNMLNAHAAAVERYRRKYQRHQRGIIGITLNQDWAEPLTDSDEDIAAAQRRNEFSMGWFNDPINFGQYPQSMTDYVGERLPKFTKEQSDRLIKSYDFLGLNHYSTSYLASLPGKKSHPADDSTSAPTVGWEFDQRSISTKFSANGTIIGPQGDSSWLNTVPWGFYKTIMWNTNRYGKLSDGSKDNSFLIYITENGCDAPGESKKTLEDALNDSFRINYFQEYLAELDRAIGDGAPIIGYFAWSLLDNFEWADGFNKRFGLHYVDYTDPARTRYAKASASWYHNYCVEHALTYSGRNKYELVDSAANDSLDDDLPLGVKDTESTEKDAPDSKSKIQSEPFLWGAATAAYQIEGAVHEDGRGETIWDKFVKVDGRIDNNDNGDIADDSYHKYREDIALVKGMGMNAYRFSIAWTRIIPDGDGEVNQFGVDYYNNVINTCIENDIEPLVTLYHWDLPQALEDRYGGWLSAEIEQSFVRYVDVCFKLFGDRVKKWITLNEPWTVNVNAYTLGVFAPGRCSDRSKCTHGDSSTEGYIAAHNMLNAHAAAVERYRRKYQRQQRGIIGITLNQDWAEPLTDSDEDIAAAQRRNEFLMGWYGDPINFGQYPQSMIDYVGERLPKFTKEQSDRLIKSYDFLGLNHYSAWYVSAVHESSNSFRKSEGWADDQKTSVTKFDHHGRLIGPQAESTWLNTVPWAFYKTIMWNTNRYGREVSGKGKSSLIIYITENGCDAPDESDKPLHEALNDTFRVDYFQSYLKQLGYAINDGANIVGYFAWSLLDNFEWADGYRKRFGLHYVDYSDPNRTRCAKSSAHWFTSYINTHANSYNGRSIEAEFVDDHSHSDVDSTNDSRDDNTNNTEKDDDYEYIDTDNDDDDYDDDDDYVEVDDTKLTFQQIISIVVMLSFLIFLFN